MKNLTIPNTVKSIAYLSLVFFAFINPYLLESLLNLLQQFILEQI